MHARAAGFRFLVNPTAGGGRPRRWLPRIEARAASLGAAVEVSRSGPDLTARARRAADEGVERLVVAGGDGTMHLVIQGLAGSACALALLPSGRGDDLARSLGVPRDPGRALELAVEGRVRTIDLGVVGDRCFASYAGAGLDSAVTETAQGQPRWLPDSVTYVLAMLRTIVRFQPPRARARYDGGEFEGPVMFVTVCNAPLFGGGMRIAPEAAMDDGALDLVIVRQVGKLELLRVFPRVFRGTHVGHPAVSFHRTRSVHLGFEPARTLGSDGELAGPIGERGLEITVRPGALRVVAP